MSSKKSSISPEEKIQDLISQINNKLERKRANIDQYSGKEFSDFKSNLLRALNNACNEDDNYCVYTLKIKRDNKSITYMNGFVISLKNIDMTQFKNDHRMLIRQWVNSVLKSIVGMYVSDQKEYNGELIITIMADHHVNQKVVHF